MKRHQPQAWEKTFRCPQSERHAACDSTIRSGKYPTSDPQAIAPDALSVAPECDRDPLCLGQFGQIKAAALGEEEPHCRTARPYAEGVCRRRVQPDQATGPPEVEDDGVGIGADREQSIGEVCDGGCAADQRVGAIATSVSWGRAPAGQRFLGHGAVPVASGPG